MAFLLGGICSLYTLTYAGAGLLIWWLWQFHRHPAGLLLLGSAFGVGSLFFPLFPDVEVKEESIHINGRIISDRDKTPSAVNMLFREEQDEQLVQVVYLNDQDLDVPDSWKHGAYCSLTGSRTMPDQARNPGEFDYRRYLQKQGIAYQVILDSRSAMTCKGSSLLAPLIDWRHDVNTFMKQSLHPEGYPWLAALVLGDDKALDEETVSLFRRWNLSHILAISGLHIGLFMGAVYFLCYRSGWLTREHAQWVLILLIPIYGLVAGGAPSVIRASIMGTIALVIVKFKLKIAPTDLLALAALTMLIISPSIIHHLGFQFSFLVTFSIVLSRPLFTTLPSGVWQLVSLSLICQMAILPIQIKEFYQFNPLSLFANILFVPYFSLIVIPFMFVIFTVTLLYSPAGYFLSRLFVTVHQVVIELFTRWDATFQFLWNVGEISLPFIVLYYVGFFQFMRSWITQKLRQTFLFGLLSVCVLIAFSLKPYLSKYGQVTMLDIGQGDAFVIELPFRKGVIMIDAAGSPVYSDQLGENYVFTRIIEPFLRSRGITTIDGLILSHNDQDHSGSARQLIEAFDVSRVYTSPHFGRHHTLKKPEQLERSAHTFLSAGQTLTIAGYDFHVLHPAGSYGNANDNSLVLSAELGKLNWLFTGDISTEIEQHILKTHPRLKADVLKVSHHGSQTSTHERWVDHLNPQAGLISVGKNNRYGHPHRMVTSLLEEKKVFLFRTDRHGAVQYRFTTDSGTFQTFLPYNDSTK
ncbi:DNA internalization-related competence protein ComEC/Rec2 [Thalassobacillus sp. CUG 92003]|uniref:DNA internalization-related competence protein ComEC/Rec2 n=1 Tax=Thalassobacillus sp. CUG 92003 TaxID=2736641 RepID=UPI002107FB75|nr:DNA internalization-related competence protein ComEC/Rec2 [Thalassobacillus sp. CUG 92003]